MNERDWHHHMGRYVVSYTEEWNGIIGVMIFPPSPEWYSNGDMLVDLTSRDRTAIIILNPSDLLLTQTYI